jgi:hypothetical protein
MAVTFESGFAEAEKAAAVAGKAAASLKVAAAALQKAAGTGDITKMRKAMVRLGDALGAVQQATTNACEAWPFSPRDEEDYLRDGYRQELTETAQAAGLSLFERDDVILAFPCVLRIDAASRSVRIDRTRQPGLRPSHVVATLRASQTRRRRLDSGRFLEVVFVAYRHLTGLEGLGTTLPLVRIYETLTLLPWVASDYGRQEFARDLLALSGSGIDATREGHKVAFPGSTGVRTTPRDTFMTVDERGETVTFYGVRFTKPEA